MSNKDSHVEDVTLNITPSKLSPLIQDMYEQRMPLMIWGSFGIGKSNIVAQAARDMGINFVDLRANLKDPVDIGGVPFVVNRSDANPEIATTRWAASGMFPVNGIHGEKGIIAIDELPTAAPATQTAFYQVILDRMVDQTPIDEGWSFICMGNRATDRAATYTMPLPLRNRMAHVELMPNTQDWVKWAQGAGISPYVLSYIRYDDKNLVTEASEVKDHNAFPTPRTWEFLSNHLNRRPDALSYNTAAMYIGTGPAQDFMAFTKYFGTLPDFKDILAKPKSTKVPENSPGSVYALCGMLAQRVDETNFDIVIDYIRRLEPEFQVMVIKDIVPKAPGITGLDSFSAWTDENVDALATA